MQGEVSMTNIESTKPYTQSQKVQNYLTLNTQICLEKEKKSTIQLLVQRQTANVLIFKYHWYRMNQIVIFSFFPGIPDVR